MARNVGCSSSGDALGDDAAIFGTAQDTGTVEEFVQTAKGKILVARQGDPKKPIIITYHDIGLNYLSNFQVGLTIVLYLLIQNYTSLVRDKTIQIVLRKICDIFSCVSFYLCYCN